MKHFVLLSAFFGVSITFLIPRKIQLSEVWTPSAIADSQKFENYAVGGAAIYWTGREIIRDITKWKNNRDASEAQAAARAAQAQDAARRVEYVQQMLGSYSQRINCQQFLSGQQPLVEEGKNMFWKSGNLADAAIFPIRAGVTIEYRNEKVKFGKPSSGQWFQCRDSHCQPVMKDDIPSVFFSEADLNTEVQSRNATLTNLFTEAKKIRNDVESQVSVQNKMGVTSDLSTFATAAREYHGKVTPISTVESRFKKAVEVAWMADSSANKDKKTDALVAAQKFFDRRFKSEEELLNIDHEYLSGFLEPILLKTLEQSAPSKL